MTRHDIAAMRAHKRFARQDYDKQVVAQGGTAAQDYGDAGPPYWNPASWDAFKAQYGRWPYSAGELPPTFDGAPDWVYQRLGLRKPPVTVNPGAI